MPDVDLTNVGDADEFSPARVGKHLCVIDSIDDSKTTQNGDEMWMLTLKVIAGDDKEKEIRDNISFGNTVALKRVKLICSRAGIDVSKPIRLVPSMLTGKPIYVEVEGHREYQDKKGKMRKAAQVGFAGYEMVEREMLDRLSKNAPAQEPIDDDPF